MSLPKLARTKDNDNVNKKIEDRKTTIPLKTIDNETKTILDKEVAILSKINNIEELTAQKKAIDIKYKYEDNNTLYEILNKEVENRMEVIYTKDRIIANIKFATTADNVLEEKIKILGTYSHCFTAEEKLQLKANIEQKLQQLEQAENSHQDSPSIPISTTLYNPKITFDQEVKVIRNTKDIQQLRSIEKEIVDKYKDNNNLYKSLKCEIIEQKLQINHRDRVMSRIENAETMEELLSIEKYDVPRAAYYFTKNEIIKLNAIIEQKAQELNNQVSDKQQKILGIKQETTNEKLFNELNQEITNENNIEQLKALENKIATTYYNKLDKKKIIVLQHKIASKKTIINLTDKIAKANSKKTLEELQQKIVTDHKNELPNKEITDMQQKITTKIEKLTPKKNIKASYNLDLVMQSTEHLMALIQNASNLSVADAKNLYNDIVSNKYQELLTENQQLDLIAKLLTKPLFKTRIKNTDPNNTRRSFVKYSTKVASKKLHSQLIVLASRLNNDDARKFYIDISNDKYKDVLKTEDEINNLRRILLFKQLKSI